MRRWALAAAVTMAFAALAVVVLAFPKPHEAPSASAGIAAMGLVLLEDDEGLYVLGVIDGSLACSAGIQPGDYLKTARNTSLATIAQLEELLSEQGGALPVTLVRRDETFTVNLSLR